MCADCAALQCLASKPIYIVNQSQVSLIKGQIGTPSFHGDGAAKVPSNVLQQWLSEHPGRQRVYGPHSKSGMLIVYSFKAGTCR